ncbi:MAG: hypothetical protein ACKO1K_08080, partial [Burkholderiales bacterium]
DRRLTHEPSWIRFLNRVFWELLRFALPIIPLLVLVVWARLLSSMEAPGLFFFPRNRAYGEFCRCMFSVHFCFCIEVGFARARSARTACVVVVLVESLGFFVCRVGSICGTGVIKP